MILCQPNLDNSNWTQFTKRQMFRTELFLPFFTSHRTNKHWTDSDAGRTLTLLGGYEQPPPRRRRWRRTFNTKLFESRTQIFRKRRNCAHETRDEDARWHSTRVRWHMIAYFYGGKYRPESFSWYNQYKSGKASTCVLFDNQIPGYDWVLVVFTHLRHFNQDVIHLWHAWVICLFGLCRNFAVAFFEQIRE